MIRQRRRRRAVQVVIDFGVGETVEVWGSYARVEHALRVVPILRRLGFHASIARPDTLRRRISNLERDLAEAMP
jgi:hypothetical protein